MTDRQPSEVTNLDRSVTKLSRADGPQRRSQAGPEPYSALSHLDCARCGTWYDADRVQGTCSCGSPLLARYDLRQVAGAASPRDMAGRSADLWRYHELLPVRQAAHVVSLGEGMTPLLAMPKIGQVLGVPDLLMKDEGLLPTGTFKARGAAVGVSRAAELGVAAIAMPTNGNAGAAWSVYAARAGMRSLIVMPVAAPQITRAECAAAGAELYLVDGGIGDAGRLVADAVARRPGYLNAATLREPYRIEGKKTMGLEIAEQLGWRMPDVIVYPAGGGVGIIGIYKALCELLELGWVTGDLPRLVAVQPDGCAPIVRAFQADATESEPWPDPKTVAFGLMVPKALGDFLVLDALYATGGTAVAVTDEALLAEQRAVARLEGSFICPEGAACFAAVRHLRASGWLSQTDRVVVLNTGTGLIYPETVPANASLLPIPPLSHTGFESVRRMPMDHETVVAYLNRVGVAAPAGGDAAGLRTLHRAHQLTVPFENLSIHLAEPISLDEHDLIDKIVRRRRGGFCYELNGAFALLLEALDAQVSRVAARVYGEDGLGPPFDHLALIVRLADGSGPWLADVGFGSHSDYPLLLDARDDQNDPAGRFRLADTDAGDIDVLKDGRPQYRIETRERSLADCVPTCWWHQTSPLSHFTRSTICSRLTPGGRVSISGRLLIQTQGGTRTERRLDADDLLLAAYRDHFGIALSRVPDDPTVGH